MAKKRKTSRSPYRLRAHVMLREPDGGSLLESPFPTAATIRERSLSPSQIAQISEKLEALGFHVVGSSPVGITVEAELPKFEGVFQSRVARAGGAQSHSDRAVFPKSLWKWVTHPRIPKSLADSVAAVVFPEAAKLHS